MNLRSKEIARITHTSAKTRETRVRSIKTEWIPRRGTVHPRKIQSSIIVLIPLKFSGVKIYEKLIREREKIPHLRDRQVHKEMLKITN